MVCVYIVGVRHQNACLFVSSVNQKNVCFGWVIWKYGNHINLNNVTETVSTNCVCLKTNKKYNDLWNKYRCTRVCGPEGDDLASIEVIGKVPIDFSGAGSKPTNRTDGINNKKGKFANIPWDSVQHVLIYEDLKQAIWSPITSYPCAGPSCATGDTK